MLYPQSQTPTLAPALFARPGSEYRGAPFWAWNCALDDARIARQVAVFKEMGLGGFHIHVRTGLATPYLSEAFLQSVRRCVEQAKQTGLLAWLYDEDRWPSGAAGGLVTANPRHRARYLALTTTPNTPDDTGEVDYESSGRVKRSKNGVLLACYDVALNQDGSLARYARMEPGQAPRGTKWYAYLETPLPSPWYNNQTYLNTLDKTAVAAFIATTHEAYWRAVGQHFGVAVPALFTDEPQFSHKQTLPHAHSTNDVALPWTDDLPQTYRAAYGEELMDTLPELFWELPAGVSRARYRYHDHVAERFAEAFADSCGAWCRGRGLALTGHMMAEESLFSQTACLGEAMRSYRAFDLPGIDMLCARFEFATAKQCQSAARQFGRPGMMSELYGVTGWDFDFRGHKLHGDWQAALGVTVRVQHLSWMSMAGEAKRDYPASIFYQSPWYKEYDYIEDHFARLNTALTRGKPLVRVGVVHPIESYWLHWGPNRETALARSAMDERFESLLEWLLLGSVDFDLICEALLPGQCPAGGAPLRVGHMAYDGIVVPQCETLRATTLDRLEAFAAAGGRLIFAGGAPTHVDAVPSHRAQTLAARSHLVSYSRGAILEALAPCRHLTLREADGSLTNDLIHQLRQDGEGRWLFVSHAREPENKDCPRPREIDILLPGAWRPTLYDTMTGATRPLPAALVRGETGIRHTLWDFDSLLLWLEPATAPLQPEPAPVAPPAPVEEALPVPGWVPVTLSEPNALLLDTARWRLDDGAWQPEEEILRLDDACRALLGWPLRGQALAQPWVVPPEPPAHTVTLEFDIVSEIEVAGAKLALENAARALVVLNGRAVPSLPGGWFVDEDIHTLSLPNFGPGSSVLRLTLPFDKRTGLEWCYILGGFGVRVAGSRAVVTQAPGGLGFGDITGQGLPFYGGNITYHIPFESPGGRLAVQASHYRGALWKADLDGQSSARVALPPYVFEAEAPPGAHVLSLTVFGHRYNAFGAVHNSNTRHLWHGPDAWRTKGCAWSASYQLKPLGLLSAPVLTLHR